MRILTRYEKYQTEEILELKSTVIEPKNSLEGFNSRLDQIEEKINKLEYMSWEIEWKGE